MLDAEKLRGLNHRLSAYRGGGLYSQDNHIYSGGTIIASFHPGKIGETATQDLQLLLCMAPTLLQELVESQLV